jgi:hypothetical protein
MGINIFQNYLNKFRRKTAAEITGDDSVGYLEDGNPVTGILGLDRAFKAGDIASGKLQISLLYKDIKLRLKNNKECKLSKQILNEYIEQVLKHDSNDKLVKEIKNSLNSEFSNSVNKSVGISTSSYGRVNGTLAKTKEISTDFGQNEQNVIALSSKPEKELGNKPKVG